MAHKHKVREVLWYIVCASGVTLYGLYSENWLLVFLGLVGLFYNYNLWTKL